MRWWAVFPAIVMGAGCASSVEPEAACAQYLACVDAVNSEVMGHLEADFGADSACWSDADSAERCGRTCEAERLDVLGTAPDEGSCQTDGVAPRLVASTLLVEGDLFGWIEIRDIEEGTLDIRGELAGESIESECEAKSASAQTYTCAWSVESALTLDFDPLWDAGEIDLVDQNDGTRTGSFESDRPYPYTTSPSSAL